MVTSKPPAAVEAGLPGGPGYFFDHKTLRPLSDASGGRVRRFCAEFTVRLVDGSRLTKTNAIQAGEMRYHDGGSSPYHRHVGTSANPDGASHCYITFKGRGLVQVGDTTQELQPGTLVHFPPGGRATRCPSYPRVLAGYARVEASALHEYLTVVADAREGRIRAIQSLLLKKVSLQSTGEFPVRLLRESDQNSLNLLVARARKLEPKRANRRTLGATNDATRRRLQMSSRHGGSFLRRRMKLPSASMP